jgi:DNA adenine methylase
MSYPGSKGQDGVWQRIIGQMPPHSVYVEPFFGSGRIFHAKRRAGRSILIDKNPAVKPADSLGPDVEFIESDALVSLNYFLDWQIFTGGLGLLTDALIYCDPPYPLSTRKGRRYYEHEMSDDDHAALLSALLQLNCRVMISSYPNPLYVDQLRDWRCVRYQTMTRGGKRIECLWCNFPEPDELHDWRFAGRNFRERWNLERARRNILAKLDAMPARKRGFVLNAIEQRQNQRDVPAAIAGNGVAGSITDPRAENGAASSK